jgi:hypothetical protein
LFDVFVREIHRLSIAQCDLLLVLITLYVVPITMSEIVGAIIPDHRLPFVVDFDLQLNDELDYAARLDSMVRPGSTVESLA